MCSFIIVKSPRADIEAMKNIVSPQPVSRRIPVPNAPRRPPTRLAALMRPVAVERISTGNRKEFRTFNEFQLHHEFYIVLRIMSVSVL